MALLGLALLLVIFALRLVDTAQRNAFTVDEPNYVGTGLYLWETGDYDYVRSLRFHPPLVFHIASLPLLFFDLGDVAITPVLGRRLIERGDPAIATLRWATRLPFVMLACWGAFLCFSWARELAGEGAGLLAAFLYTQLPSLLAHGSLVHSDITISVLFLQTLYSFWRWLERPGRGRLLVCGVSLGLAMIAKLTSILLPPILGLTLLLVLWPRRALGSRLPEPVKGSLGERLRFGALAVGTLAACAMAVVWLGYGGSFRSFAQSTGPFADISLPSYLQSFLFVDHVNRAGRAVYYLGEFSTEGWWHFFPVAFGLKEPVTFSVLTAAALLSLGWRRGGLGRFLAPTFVVYGFILVIWVDVPLGYRYALPLLPLLVVWIASQLWPLRSRAAGSALAVACALLLFESLWVHPHYLGHFNALAGGPDRGPEYLLDANLDWGQDVTTLVADLEARGNPPVWLALYGVEDPVRQGVRGRPLRGCRPVGGWIAISANVRHGLYGAHNPLAPARPDCYAWLDAYEPVARLGGSIWLYHLPERT